nr:M20/M25/M40 family metallo-hydrolase [Bacilli bacterium]
MNENLERFLRYIKIDTQSDDESTSTPSAKKEYDLLNLLRKELLELGIEGEITKEGRLYAFLEGEKGLDVIGLNSHVDTALEMPGKNVKAQIIENYDGGYIKLNDEYQMSPKEFSSLKGHKGDTLVVTSGDTLLGGDDKAGVAVIMSVLAYLVKNKEVKHHPIAILFTPDEEIGRGPEHFDAKKFGADYAYTIDGDYPDHIDIENFN